MAAMAFSALMGGQAYAQQKLTFALVPKNMNNPFFDQARDGCKKAEAESKGAFQCMYIGPGAHGGGEEQVQIVQTIKPKGGTICIQSGGAAAANHNERMKGIRDTLAGKSSAQSPGDRLTGQNGWKEIDGCPLYTNDDFPVSVQQFQDIMAKNPNLDAFTPTGGFPQFVPDANRAAVAPFKDKIAKKELALVVADTLPVQIDQMKEGLSLGQVGQRPFEMGYKTMFALKDVKGGKAPPADPTYTGLDVCTSKNLDTCIAK